MPTSEQIEKALAGIDTASVVLESLTVDTASRKIMELERETTPAVVAARAQFFATISTTLGTQTQPPVTLLAAMSNAGGQLLGLGPEPGFTIPDPMVLYSASSIGSFYQFNISTAWKLITALSHFNSAEPKWWASIGSPVYELWLAQVANNTIPSEMIDQGSMASTAGSWTWWTPDSRMNIPPAADSGTSNAGTQAFFTQCWVVSLAPEWNPYGLVTFAFTYDSSQDQLRRPTPYDGASSPPWVQRPADQSPRTGGDAIETLLGSALPITRVQPIPTYVISAELVAALLAAVPVDVYAQNLCEVKFGTTDASRLVAAWQILITEQCRAARHESDQAFDAQLVAATCPCNKTATSEAP